MTKEEQIIELAIIIKQLKRKLKNAEMALARLEAERDFLIRHGKRWQTEEYTTSVR